MKACFLKKLDESLLTNLPPFRSLTEQQIREILDSAQTARYDAGKPVFAEGRAVDRFFLLLDGHVHVQRTTSEGDQIILLHIAPGQLFGIGASWGGYESLALPVQPLRSASACPWGAGRSAVRLHIGLEQVDDLIADLSAAFTVLARTC